MPELDLTRLETLAQAATPGAWIAEQDSEYPTRCLGIRTTDGKEIIKTDGGFYPPRWPDAQFIAAANPLVLLALLARLRQMEATLVQARRVLADNSMEFAWLDAVLPPTPKGAK